MSTGLSFQRNYSLNYRSLKSVISAFQVVDLDFIARHTIGLTLYSDFCLLQSGFDVVGARM